MPDTTYAMFPSTGFTVTHFLGRVDKFSRAGSSFVPLSGHPLRAGDNTRHI